MREVIYLLVAIMVIAASCTNTVDPQPSNPIDLKEQLIKHNQKKVRTEIEIINDFVAKNYPQAQETETGLRFELIHPEKISPRSPIKGDHVRLKYQVERMDGSLVYLSDNSGIPEIVHVAYDDSPAGLHEGLQLMGIGDSAVFILPSHLGYGLTGDQNRIGKNAILIYKVVLIDIK